MLDMAQRLVEQHRHVRVIQPIDRLPTRANADDEMKVTKDPQLMRNRRLRHPHRGTQIPHAARALP